MEYQQDYHLLYSRVSLVFVLLTLTITNTFGQTIKNQNIGTLGSTVSMQKGITYRSVVGQASNINLMVVDKTPISQGFIHPQGNINAREKSTRNLNMSVYPNPSNKTFIIEATLIPGDRIEVRNILGMVVFSESIYSSVQTKPIDIGYCADGLYTLSIFGETKHLQTKLIEIIK